MFVARGVEHMQDHRLAIRSESGVRERIMRFDDLRTVLDGTAHLLRTQVRSDEGVGNAQLNEVQEAEVQRVEVETLGKVAGPERRIFRVADGVARSQRRIFALRMLVSAAASLGV